jgi:transposase-like protein
MKQTYHSNANTNLNIRYHIKNSKESLKDLSVRYNTSVNTISKWQERIVLTDKSSKPNSIVYALTDTEKSLLIGIRKSTWLPLDQIHDMMLLENKLISRSSIYRTLVAENINAVPELKKDKAKTFKAYQPGYLHIDVTYLPKFEGKSAYLFVAIDRATRAMYYQVYEQKTADNAAEFMDTCIGFFPFQISHVLTDNGLEFTNRLIKSKKGELCTKPSKVDLKCARNDIEHRLTKPSTPQTNGMVERVNGTIKNNTIIKNDYKNQAEMKDDLIAFMGYYNLYRTHGSLKKELKINTPMQAIEKWYQLKPDIFTQTPTQFKTILLNLTSQ